MRSSHALEGVFFCCLTLAVPLRAWGAPDIPLVDPTPAQVGQMAQVRDDVIGQLTAMAPPAAEVTDAIAGYDAANIVVNGIQISGTVPADLTDFGTKMLTLARDWRINGNTDSLAKASNGLWLAIANDKAWTGYYTRELNNAVVLLCNDAEGPAGDAVRMFVQSYFDHLWQFDPTKGGEDTDFIYTGMISLLGMAAHCGDDAHRFQQMRLVKDYLQRALAFTPGTSDFIKVDGSTFHHWTHYPAYMYALRILLRDYLMRVHGTEFQIDAQAYGHLRDTAIAYSLYSTGYMSNGLCGRHPFEFTNPFEAQDYYDMASSLGDEILGNGVDLQIAKLHNWFWPDQAADLKTYGAEEPVGFWQFNYGAFGVYRGGRGGSFVTLKGFNSMAWGTEIYLGENRFGRYQSYGTLDVAYPGDGNANGYVAEGWDWNVPPGTTTIHLPWASLAAIDDGQSETTLSRFAGALSFPRNPEGIFGIEGEMGIFAMDFQQQKNSIAHDSSFRFKKSTIAFDGMLLALGSNIHSDDQTHPTRTNLFQRHVDLPTTADKPSLIIDGKADPGFPYDHSFKDGDAHWLLDSRMTGYYFPPGNDALQVLGRSQTTPTEINDGSMSTGDFGVGWIDHGIGPVDADYEFIVVPAATSTEMDALASKPLPYKIHDRDSASHVVEFLSTKTWAYAVFESESQWAEGPVASASEPCLIVARATATGLSLSMANPNLNIGYRSLVAAPVAPIIIGLRGDWLPPELPPNVHLGPQNPERPDDLILTFDTLDGLPIDIELSSKINENGEGASDCGCRVVGDSDTSGELALVFTMIGVVARRRRMRQRIGR
ncbi:MAG TPA: polysaccharide lyase family 8 super-sandwich domain-containing protein [Polyangium sp.]|nr:polysaccharide lyase family 8 super-sandwich domain-containing protein [Polyangium sp.]